MESGKWELKVEKYKSQGLCCVKRYNPFLIFVREEFVAVDAEEEDDIIHQQRTEDRDHGEEDEEGAAEDRRQVAAIVIDEFR